MGVNEEDSYCAYPLTLHSRAPIGCAHSILGVTDQVFSHIHYMGQIRKI